MKKQNTSLMKKLSWNISIMCLLLAVFSFLGCESVPWDLVASSLYTVNDGLQSALGSSSRSNGSSSYSTTSTQQYNMTIVNNTGYTVWYVYLSPSDSSSWGDDWLGSSVLRHGEIISVGLPSGGRWDIKLVDEDNDAYTKYEVSADSWIIFTFSDYVGRN